jgi:hypothetical protein
MKGGWVASYTESNIKEACDFYASDLKKKTQEIASKK